jgi:ribonuclease P protein component
MAEKSLTEEGEEGEKFSALNFYYPKAYRLRKRYEYIFLFKQGTRLIGSFICVDYMFSTSSETRLGITVSTRYGKAYERNHFKRKVREAFRLLHPFLPQNLQINVIPRYKSKNASSTQIKKELEQLIAQIP